MRTAARGAAPRHQSSTPAASADVACSSAASPPCLASHPSRRQQLEREVRGHPAVGERRPRGAGGARRESVGSPNCLYCARQPARPRRGARHAQSTGPAPPDARSSPSLPTPCVFGSYYYQVRARAPATPQGFWRSACAGTLAPFCVLRPDAARCRPSRPRTTTARRTTTLATATAATRAPAGRSRRRCGESARCAHWISGLAACRG